MKTLLSIAILWLIVLQTNGQRTVEKKHTVSSNHKIHLEFDFADEINIQTWDKNEVYVKAIVNINEGENNDNFKFNVKEGSTFLSIESEIEDLDKIARECSTIIIEDGDTTFYSSNGAKMDLHFEVFLPDKLDTHVETINGDIQIKGLTGPMDISTINGEIELFIPYNLKADLNMETINGTMYTDLDLDIQNKKNNMCKIGGDIETKLNGGGSEINLSTINGVMYLRKI